ncbi:hypothetical protein DV736_g6329, partial [Chaetothyriales sp. CBS 134916]
MSIAPRSQPFSLFPHSVPKIATPNPRNRAPTLHTVKPLEHLNGEAPQVPAGAPWNVSNEGAKRSAGGAVITTTIDAYSRSPSPNDIGKAVTTMSPVDGSTPTVALPTSQIQKLNTPPPKTATSPPSQPLSERPGSTTLVQYTPPGAATDPSPVVPFRSMFPTYNPSLPLSQQNYYPQRPFPVRLSSISRSNVSRSEYRNTMTTPVDRALGARSAPASVLNFGFDSMSVNEPQFSSHRELEKLWEASHGTEPNSSIKSFTLEMSRTEDAVFTFGADPQYPFYTLSTFDTAEISVKKTSPKKRTEVQDVIMSSIEPPARRLPPHDGLVTFIFPKMAAMLALNQSALLAKAHGLASVDKDEVEEAAVRRAAQQEACNLRWNETWKRYELEHPAIARRAQDPNFIMSPTSPQLNAVEKPVLHISVSSNSTGGPVSAASSPVILLTNPHKTSSPTSSAGPGLINGIRLSTLPQSDTDSPLASLNLGNLTLSIDADQILSLMPSLFAIDSVISAILAVAVADKSTNPVLGAMPIWSPRPKAPASLYSVGTGPVGVKSYAGSNLYATIAEREEAEEEAAELKKEHEKDITYSKRQKKYTGKRNWYGKKEVVKQTKKQVVMGEFDLEKLGHYQGGDRRGQELPALTRALVGGLVAVLRFHPTDIKLTFPADLSLPAAVSRNLNNILQLHNCIGRAKLRHHEAKYCLPFPPIPSGQQTGHGEAHPHVLPLFRLAIAERLQHRLSTTFIGQSIDMHPLGLTLESVKFRRQAYDAKSGAVSELEYMWLA